MKDANLSRDAGRAAGGPRLSVVVIGRNEGGRLSRCLASISALAEDSAPAEVVYVDSGSTDNSVARAKQMGATTIALHPARPTAALGRNAGWRAVTGEFVLFLDGDTELAPLFLSRALPCFADPLLAVVWGHRRELRPETSLYNEVSDLDWIHAPGPAAFCGGDAVFRRRVLLETGGFDETLIAGEEPELCQRIQSLGGKILHIDEPMTGHDLQITRFTQYWRRAERAGHAYAEVSARFAGMPNPFWSGEAGRNRRRAMVLLGLPVSALLASLVWRSVLPFALFVVLFAVLVVRTAWKARWKSSSVRTLLLYGVHSHLQQIPIFVGQMRFLVHRGRGLRHGLMEYKER